MGRGWIVVTGASSGIGRAAADGLAARGWRVIATARADADLETLRLAGHKALHLELADARSVHAFAGAVEKICGGRLQALFNNAGYGTERPMLDGPFNAVVPWHYERLPELLGAGRGFDVRTEDELDAALAAARDARGEYSLLRVHLRPDDMSSALRRLTALLAERVKP
mgnify:CR=1 FL=1